MKNVIIILLILCSQIIFAAVDTRLVFVSNSRDFPSPGLSTLVLDVEAISNSGNIQISAFQDAIQLDAIFRAQNPSVSFTNQLFPSSAYNTTQDYNTTSFAGRIRYLYTFNAGTRGTINTTYTRILTISIQYTTGPSNGSISWSTFNPQFSVADLNFAVITGTELSIPAELNSVPLPVELSSFTGKMYEQDKVKLNWKTQTEVNNYGFEVERQASNGQWEKVGFVAGNGNSNSPKEYSYIDKNLTGGSKFLYRLKQVDNDGQTEYSDAVEVEVVPSEYALSQNYPNPFNPSTTIRFSLPKQTQFKLNLYNMLGELVETVAEGIYEAGYYKISFDASNLPSGVYIYRIESSDFVKTMKMILMK